jgi:hypothetical protein
MTYRSAVSSSPAPPPANIIIAVEGDDEGGIYRGDLTDGSWTDMNP